MSDLATMIREYYDAAAEPVDAAEILTGAGAASPLHPPHRGRRWRPFWVAAGAAVLVVLAIGIVVLPGLLGGESEDPAPVATTVPTITTPATSVPPATTLSPETTQPSTEAPAPTDPVLDLSALDWAPMEDGAVFRETSVFDIVPWSSGLVAVGASDVLAGSVAEVWVSPDGRSWSRVEGADEVVVGESSGMVAVAANGARLVAVGAVFDEAGGRRPMVWTSNANEGWTRAANNFEVFGVSGILVDVVFHLGRFVAVGQFCDEAECHVAAWSSPDGSAWARTWTGESQAFISALHSGEVLIAVGNMGDPPDPMAAAAWTSPDGVEWTRAPHDEAVLGGRSINGLSPMASMLSIAESPIGDGSVLAGGFAGGTPRFWSSPDGVTWQIAADLPEAGDVSAMATYDQTTVAVGTSIWRSTDGVSWREVADPGNRDLWAVGVGEWGWVVIPGDVTGAWVSPPPP